MITVWTILQIVVTLVAAYPSEQPLPVQVKDGEYLVGGDMIFVKSGREQENMRGVAQSLAGTRWDNRTLIYVMSDDFSKQLRSFYLIIIYFLLIHIAPEQQELITGAMKFIESSTAIGNRKCVQFRPKVATDRYWVSIKTGVGCSAHV